MIVEHNWVVGGIDIYGTDRGAEYNAKMFYDYELGKNKFQIGDEVCYTEDFSKIPCTEDDIIYKDEIGLMYVSDYMYGAESKYWNLPNYNYLNYSSPYGDYRDSIGSDWLINYIEWTISRGIDSVNIDSFSDHNAFAISTDLFISQNIFLQNVFCHSGGPYAYIVRPTFYISSDVILSSGEGTKTSPYKLVLQ